VLLSPTAVAPDSPESYYSAAKRVERERPGAFLTNQYHNPANPQAHYETTGPELWDETAGRITHFVAGMGTGGTISGTAKYLKEKNPKVQVIGADPVGSILKHYHETGEIIEAHTYKIEGVGEDFIPSATDFKMIDKVISCGDRAGLNMARRLAREEAIFTGGSGGMAAWVALEVARTLPADALLIVLIPDTGERYLSKVHNDEWMRDNHLLDPSRASAGEVVDNKSRHLPRLISVEAGAPLKQALLLVQQHEISQIPVFRRGELVGTLEESEILKAAVADPAAIDRPVDGWMKSPLAVVDAGEHVDQVARRLAKEPAVLVRRNGGIAGILTRYDMLQFIAGAE
jgi:cystathionine beta-synthase